jgi:hypothetical protein
MRIPEPGEKVELTIFLTKKDCEWLIAATERVEWMSLSPEERRAKVDYPESQIQGIAKFGLAAEFLAKFVRERIIGV